MSKKLLLSILGAGLIMGMTAPAFAQNGHNNSDHQRTERVSGERADDDWRQDYSDRGRADRNRYDNYRHRDYGRPRIVKRQSFSTRGRARIHLIETRVQSRRGASLVCTVSVQGRDARYVSRHRLRNIAVNNCSRRARIVITA